MATPSQDGFRQGEAGLEHAHLSVRKQGFAWRCFSAQHAAEEALQAVFYAHHAEPLGHSLLALMQALPTRTAQTVTPELLDAARALDRHYIQARSPNAFASGAPLDYFTERDARESIDHARSILDYCRTQIRQP